MHRYHIGFKTDKEATHSEGVNIDAFSMMGALKTFEIDYKGIEPTYIEDKGSVKEFEFPFIPEIVKK